MRIHWTLILAAAMCLAVAAPAIADVFNMPGGLTSLEFVTVGNAGNADDAHGDGFGGVGYIYQIGKFEVTNGQYAQFLNAVAATDTHGLYNTNMASGSADTGGIARSGGPGSFTYSARPGRENHPVNYVSFWDGCRFANWLHNGQPTGSQAIATTESGAYHLNGITSPEGMGIARSPGASVFLPSEDEWYKSAYYAPSLNGGLGGYFDYPTGTNATPSNALINPDPGNNANFDGESITTRVGEFENSESPYDTFDQGGNVAEWSEIVPDIFGASCTRGGSFTSSGTPTAQNLLASAWTHTSQPTERYDIGFRVAAVPEPCSLGLLSLGGLVVLRRKKQ